MIIELFEKDDKVKVNTAR